MNKLKELRKAKKVTQVEVAKYLGITNTAYSQYETEKRGMNADILLKLSEYFNVPVDAILGRDDAAAEQLAAPVVPGFITEPLPPETARIPILGSVRAGYGGLAIQEEIGFLDVGDDLKRRFPDAYVLYVKGDSMTPEANHGDLAICNPQPIVDNGDVAIICINGDEGTVKRVYLDKKGLTIVPSNPDYQEVHYTPEQVRTYPVNIIAKVVEIRHRYS